MALAVRTVATVDEIVDVDEPLRDQDYVRAYQRTREVYGAPFPECVTTEDDATSWDTAIDFFHLDRNT